MRFYEYKYMGRYICDLKKNQHIGNKDVDKCEKYRNQEVRIKLKQWWASTREMKNLTQLLLKIPVGFLHSRNVITHKT